jgi:hypothetical protein
MVAAALSGMSLAAAEVTPGFALHPRIAALDGCFSANLFLIATRITTITRTDVWISTRAPDYAERVRSIEMLTMPPSKNVR